jgi:hypothetical protein
MMHRIDSTNAVNGRFVAGNPVTGVRPTTHTADHDNALQDEICNVIIAAGITLDKSINNQLLLAINTLIDQRITSALQNLNLGAGGSGTATCQQVAAILTQYGTVDLNDGTLHINCPDDGGTEPPPAGTATLDPDTGILTSTLAGDAGYDPTTGELTLSDTATEFYTFTHPDLGVTTNG